MIFTSDNDHFIIGAIMFEFLPTFTKPEEELVSRSKTQQTFLMQLKIYHSQL